MRDGGKFASMLLFVVSPEKDSLLLGCARKCQKAGPSARLEFGRAGMDTDGGHPAGSRKGGLGRKVGQSLRLKFHCRKCRQCPNL